MRRRVASFRVIRVVEGPSSERAILRGSGLVLEGDPHFRGFENKEGLVGVHPFKEGLDLLARVRATSILHNRIYELLGIDVALARARRLGPSLKGWTPTRPSLFPKP